MRLQVLLFTLSVLLLAPGGAPAGASGMGAFSLSNATAVLGQSGVTTLGLNASWDPPASDILLDLRYDPEVIRYEGSRFLAGGTASATRIRAGTVLVQVVDVATGFETGPIAEFTFSGLQNGSSLLGIELERVRAYRDGQPVEITDSAAAIPGIFTVLAPPPANATIGPTVTPNMTSTGTPSPTPTVTVPPSLPTLPPETAGTPSLPPTTVLHGDDYTGAVSPTPTVVPIATTPGSSRTIAEIAAANPDFSAFVNATRAGQMFEVLNGPGPLTAFVPTNAAFDGLPSGAFEALLANRTALELLLRYHLAPGTFTVSDVTARASVPTLLGVPLTVGVRPGGAVGIDGANLTLLDIPAANGMVHLVDGVLVPPGMALAPSPAATPTPMATAASSPLPTLPTQTGEAGIAAVGALAIAVLVAFRRR